MLIIDPVLARHDHIRFWTTGKRDQLRRALDELWSPLGLSYQVLCARLGEAGHRKPSKKTLQNFRNGQPLARSAGTLTDICLVLSELAKDLPEDSLSIEYVHCVSALAAELDAALPQQRPSTVREGNTIRWPKARLEELIRLIPVPDADIDPTRPEFPATNPRFPATPIKTLAVNGRNILIKDESWNWTGSHKDRWAWEQLILYKNKLFEELRSAEAHGRLHIVVPQISMISNGSAAFALQALLRLWSLPPLRVLVAKGRIRPRYVKALRAIGAEVFESTEVDERELSGKDICELTENPRHDMDVTGGVTADDIAIKYYDWLACEVLKKYPRYIFCPVGTGDLFFSIIKFIERELSGERPRDCRIEELGDDDLRGIHVFGATTDRKTSNMDKLYARWRPSLKFIESSVDKLVRDGVIGSESGIHYLENDNYAIEAQKLAKDADINTEHSGIAGLALLLKLIQQGKIPDDASVMVINTGWLSPVLGTQT